MAPSVQQLAEDVPQAAFEKLGVKDAVKQLPVEEKKEETVRVKRQIEVEGGKTDATVSSSSSSIPSNTSAKLVQYPAYLPTWNHGQKYPPLEPFEHIEHAKDADPSFKDLLPEGSTAKKLTPTTGSVVTGVQLSSLTKEGKDQLALLVAQRKVVAFRDQNFADLPLERALEFGNYFGRHHIHPTSGSPEGFPELHIVSTLFFPNLFLSCSKHHHQ